MNKVFLKCLRLSNVDESWNRDAMFATFIHHSSWYNVYSPQQLVQCLFTTAVGTMFIHHISWYNDLTLLYCIDSACVQIDMVSHSAVSVQTQSDSSPLY